MTLTLVQCLFYIGALAALFLTPGPVWFAMIARGLSGGFRGAVPLALGVVVGDVLWPLLAILGVSWIVSQYAGFLTLLRWLACITFLVMGLLLLRKAGRPASADSALTRPGLAAGFLAGVAVILGNPKAILFYMGVLPGFFDLGHLTRVDIAVICLMSMAVPLAGNLLLALSIDRIRGFLARPGRIVLLNRLSGALLVIVGLAIPFV